MMKLVLSFYFIFFWKISSKIGLDIILRIFVLISTDKINLTKRSVAGLLPCTVNICLNQGICLMDPLFSKFRCICGAYHSGNLCEKFNSSIFICSKLGLCRPLGVSVSLCNKIFEIPL